MRAYRLPGPRQRAEAVLLLCLNLPRINRHVLRFLTDLLYEVAHSKGSRMSAFNLAAIFTPNILKPESDDDTTISDLELQNHAACVGVVEFLIENHEQIGRVPPHVLRQAMSIKDEDRARREYFRDVMGKRLSWWSQRTKRKVGTSDLRRQRLGSMAALEMIKTSELGIYDANGGSHTSRPQDTSTAIADIFQVRRPITVWEQPLEEEPFVASTTSMTTITTTTKHATYGFDKDDVKAKSASSLIEIDAPDGPFGFGTVQGFDSFIMY